MSDSRKTQAVPRGTYRNLLKAQGTCVIDGKEYRRVPAGDVTKSTDICVSAAHSGATVVDGGTLNYYRAIPPPPPPPPSSDVLDRVQRGEGTGDEIVAVAVWARHTLAAKG